MLALLLVIGIAFGIYKHQLSLVSVFNQSTNLILKIKDEENAFDAEFSFMAQNDDVVQE